MILSKFLRCRQASNVVRFSLRCRHEWSFARGQKCLVPRNWLLSTVQPLPAVRLLTAATLTAATLTAAIVGYKTTTLATVAECKQKTRVVERDQDDAERKFNWSLFCRYLWPDWLLISVAVLSALVVAALNVQIPISLGEVISVVSSFSRKDIEGRLGSFVDAVQGPAVRLIAIYAAQSMFTFIYISSLSFVGERFSTRLRAAVFESVLGQDIAYFDATKTGEIMNTLSGDVQEFKSCFKQIVSQGLRNIAQTIGCAITLYTISPKMTGLLMLIVTSIMGMGTLLGSRLRKLSARAQAQTAHAVGVADEAVANIRTVRAFAMENSEQSVLREELHQAEYFNCLTGLGIGVFQALTNLFLNGITLGVLFGGGKLIGDGEITAGNLMSFMVASQTIQRSLSQTFVLFSQYVKAKACGARVFDLIEMRPTIPLKGGKQIPGQLIVGEIQLRNVTFAYPTRPNQDVLKDLSLRIPPGKVVALCGSSGSGKSTIAALIERFYDVNAGEVLLDGVNVKELDGSWLRGSVVGFISQEPVLFATSILENIRYGQSNATDEQVMEAARQANAHDFIMSFEDGYNTVLGERGVTVSGGQKQRIAIARALLKDPQVLILDEATSALDAESEKIVQQTLDRVIKGRSVLVIAHRLSTIRNADIIYVMRNGKVIESGDHTTLTSLKGAYWRLIQEQSGEDDRPMSRSKVFFGRTLG